MSLGLEMETMYDGPAQIKSERFDLPSDVTWKGGLNGFELSGPFNSAKVLSSDDMACKAYVTVIDSVLLPFEPSDVSGATIASGASVGAPQCVVSPNSIIMGDEISTSTVKDVGACCDACSSSGGCNAWVYCAMESGCVLPDGSSVMPSGTCTLKRSPNVQEGRFPNYSYSDSKSTFPVSGWIPISKQLEQISGGSASNNVDLGNNRSSQDQPNEERKPESEISLDTLAAAGR